MSGDGFYSDPHLQSFAISVPFTAFVETGTGEGDTARWMAARCQRVFTCETNLDYLAALDGTLPKNVSLYEMCSPEFIVEIKPLVGHMPLFFLDAHWEAYWPLLDELRAITENYQRGIIIVHDCTVPGRPNFWTCRGGGGADNANGPECNWEYVKGGLDWRNQFRLFYPTYGSQTPGWLALYMNLAPIGNLTDLKEESVLR